jgi:hypothetical protein
MRGTQCERHVAQHRAAQLGHLPRPKIGPVKGQAGAHARIFGGQFRTQIKPFFEIGLARGELAADREPAAPGDAAFGHRDFGLRALGQREETPAGAIEVGECILRNTVARDVEEPSGAAGGGDRFGDLVARRCRLALEERGNVDRMQRRFRCHPHLAPTDYSAALGFSRGSRSPGPRSSFNRISYCGKGNSIPLPVSAS